jgi:hypothetical protein
MALVRPRLNDHHNLAFAQEEVDFAIPFLDEDVPLPAAYEERKNPRIDGRPKSLSQREVHFQRRPSQIVS